MSNANLQYIYRACQHDTGVEALQEMRNVLLPEGFDNNQQAMLEVRVVMEELNVVARSEKTYGRGDVAAALIRLGVCALAMASGLRARDEYEVVRGLDDPGVLSLSDGETPRKKKKSRAKPGFARLAA